jgi:FkbM family methyltransferase
MINSQLTPERQQVWRFFDGSQQGFFLDVGANEPKKGSQTWFLEEQGWRGILVEPQARLAEKLRVERPQSRVFQVACGAPGHPAEMTLHIAEAASQSSLRKHLIGAKTKYVDAQVVKIMTIDEILAEAGNPALDYVSIDVEGTQLEVLRGFSLRRHQPRLVLVEDHLNNLAAHRLVQQQGYRLVKRTGLNNWYIPGGQPFALSGPVERFRLWKRLWLNTPFRKARRFLERKGKGVTSAGEEAAD